MSVISFIKKLWAQIEALFQHIPSELKSAIALGVNITENIKKLVDSPVTDVLTAIIPGDADDAVVAALRAALPQILTQLKLTGQCMNTATDDQAITTCGIQTLQNLSGDVKNSFLHSLSILLAQVAADGKLTWQDGVYLLEWYYQKKYKALV